MNYLAHALFSFDHPEILTGNMISDFVKGRRRFDYPAMVQKGISLHRSIDEFTDQHPVTREARKLLKPAVGLYAGAFVDIVYDHFLAMDTTTWQQPSLQQFAQSVYQHLDDHLPQLPPRFQQVVPYMKQYNWLYNYQFTWGVERSFEGLVRRAAYLQEAAPVYDAFLANYQALAVLSDCFISDVKKFASLQFHQLVQH